MKCLQNGYRVTEVPTREYRRQGGVSKIHVMKVAHLYVWNLFRGVACRRKPHQMAGNDRDIRHAELLETE